MGNRYDLDIRTEKGARNYEVEYEVIVDLFEEFQDDVSTPIYEFYDHDKQTNVVIVKTLVTSFEYKLKEVDTSCSF